MSERERPTDRSADPHTCSVQQLTALCVFTGIYIEEILTKWRGDYDKLEHNHTYIQW